MLTWRLWNSLRRPPFTHPLFFRLAPPPNTSRFPWWWQNLTPLMGVLLLACLLSVLINAAWLRWAIISILLLPVLLGVVLLFSGTLVGALIALGVAGGVAQAERSGMLDLLGLTPHGRLLSLWTVMAGAVWRRVAVRWLIHERFGMAMLAVFPLYIIVTWATVWASPYSPEAERHLMSNGGFAATLAAFNTGVLLFVLHTDLVQCGALGLLIGALNGLRQPNRPGAQAGALLLYLAWQSGTALLALLTWVMVANLTPSQPLVLLVLPACLGTVVVYSLREAALHRLWRQLLRAVEADEADAQRAAPRVRPGAAPASWNWIGEQS